LSVKFSPPDIRCLAIVFALSTLSISCSDSSTDPDSSFDTTPTEPIPTAVRIVNGSPQLYGIGSTMTLQANVIDQNGQAINGLDIQWFSTNLNIASVSENGSVTTHAEGVVNIVAGFDSLTDTLSTKVIRVKKIPVDSYLATPIENAIWEIPVAIVAFLPTADGINIDVSKIPLFFNLEPRSLSQIESDILNIFRRKKMAIEQGSRFRGYSDPNARPSIGYRIIEQIIVYDLIPASPHFEINGVQAADYFTVMTGLGLDSLVNNEGVREIWLTMDSFDIGYPSYDPAVHDLKDRRWIPESNMSSPITGDISNSFRLPDLPILDHTYVIYGIAWHRSQAEAIHNVGHQFEAMFSHVNYLQDLNTNLFWRNFVGQNNQNQFISGRAGWTHMPPNTTDHYDYLNSRVVSSDIEDWRPDGSGTLKAVSVNTWAAHSHPWPGQQEFGQRTETQWYIYWMQNFPGHGNQIPHGDQWMTNWWSIFADWDAAITSGLGLYGPTPSAVAGNGIPFKPPLLTETISVPVHHPLPK